MQQKSGPKSRLATCLTRPTLGTLGACMPHPVYWIFMGSNVEAWDLVFTVYSVTLYAVP